MINKKNKTYFFVVISFVCIAFIVGFHILDGRNITLFDPIIEYIKQYHIKDVVNIVAILSGISAILVGIASIRISNLGAVKEYFQQGDNKEYTTARHNLYGEYHSGRCAFLSYGSLRRVKDQNRKNPSRIYDVCASG